MHCRRFKEMMYLSAAETLKKKKHIIDIETENLSDRNKLILQLMWPALLENVLATLVSMADTIMVSSLGTGAINAVSLCTQPRFIVLAGFMALGTGTTALVARAKGAGNREEANHALRQSLVLAIGLVALLCLAMFLWHEPLIRFVAGKNISEATIQDAFAYFRVQIIGFPTLGLSFIINAALRGAGNTRAAFYSNSLSNIVNVIFNYLLIGGHFGFPALGVEGASIATVIGQSTAFIFCMYWVLSGKQYVCLRGSKLSVDPHMIRRVARVGMPALLEQVIMRVGMMLFTLIVTSLGETSYGAHNIAINIQSMSFTTGMAFGVAATTLTGQTLGRKRPDLSRWYVRQAIRMSYVVSFVVAFIIFFFGGAISGIYSKEVAVVTLAAMVLRIIAVVNPLSNTRFVYNSALRGAGDARFTAVSTFLGVALMRPCMAGLLVYVFNLDLTGVWIAMISDALLCYFLGRWRWRTGKWATIRV